MALTGICGFSNCKFWKGFNNVIFSISHTNISIRESLKGMLNIPEQYWTGDFVDCSYIKSQPKSDISFIIINGQSFEFSAKEYLTIKDDKCTVKIDTHPDDAGYDIIFGQNFMKKYYTAYDIEQNTIGIAPAVQQQKRSLSKIE